MTTSAAPPVAHQVDFSLVLGGPLYQLWRRTHLAGDGLQLVRRRIAVFTLVTWAPLAILSLAEGHAWSGVALPFLRDFELHARFLLAMPLLIGAELIVHWRLEPVVRQFVDRGLIPAAARAEFDAALAAARRLRNSIPVELILLVFVYGVGVGLLWRTQIALHVPNWHGAPVDGQWRPTMAGWWLGLVSLPVFQFLLFRWYFRLFVWARFLWHMSRLDLQLVPSHPDRCGGLGFLSSVVYAFTPLLVAQGVLLAGMIADRIFYAGAQLLQFQVDVVGLVAAMVFAVLGPLLAFAPRLEAVKRAGLREYGILAQRYVRDYDRKWLRGGSEPAEPLLGSADIQSLADLGNSFEVVQQMRFVPFALRTVAHLAVATLAPLLPLVLTMFSLDELLNRLLQFVF